jgi:LAO/AO transport system kinase
MPEAREQRDSSTLLEAAREGDRLALARLVSRLERGGATGREVAALAYRGVDDVPTVGITGAPGAGKSTLVSRLIGVARKEHESLGVIAVDPTSPFSGGAILGDRVRMQDHALDHGVFIRSMATRGHLGGLSIAVPEGVRLLGAAGLERVFVETVGVGQVEIEVASATDTVVVVVTPGWGDSVQANKAGILEVADIFVVNKADRPGARQTRLDLDQMLDLAPPTAWRPPIVDTVASEDRGVVDLWAEIRRHEEHLAETGELAGRREARLERELRRVLRLRIEAEIDNLCNDPGYGKLVGAVINREIDPYEAADRLVAAVGRSAG